MTRIEAYARALLFIFCGFLVFIFSLLGWMLYFNDGRAVMAQTAFWILVYIAIMVRIGMKSARTVRLLTRLYGCPPGMAEKLSGPWSKVSLGPRRPDEGCPFGLPYVEVCIADSNLYVRSIFFVTVRLCFPLTDLNLRGACRGRAWLRSKYEAAETGFTLGRDRASNPREVPVLVELRQRKDLVLFIDQASVLALFPAHLLTGVDFTATLDVPVRSVWQRLLPLP